MIWHNRSGAVMRTHQQERIHRGDIDGSTTTAQTLANVKIETQTAKVEQTFDAVATGDVG
jgi:hypothetical protein